MTYSAEVLADTPAAYWKLDDATGTTATDSSGNARHGTYHGTPALAADDVFGHACPTFDGVNDRVALPALNIAAGGAYTVEALARADALVSEAEVISETYGGGSDGVLASIGIKIGTATTPGLITAGSYSGGEGSPAWTWHVLEDVPWVVGDPHHLVYTHDGTTARFYVDGALVDTATFNIFGSTLAWNIGVKYDGSTFWNGAIADVALYGTALSLARIEAHYDALSGGPADETGAVDFTAEATTSFAGDVITDTGPAVAFTATATLATASPVESSGDTASMHFTAAAVFDAVTRPVGRRRRIVVVDINGEPYGELENANIGSVTFTLNEPESWAFTLPLHDPKANLLLDEKFREVQFWRGDQLLAWGPIVRPSADKTNLAVNVEGVLWYLTRRFVGRASRRNYVTNGDFENGTNGWELGALNPLESIATRSPDYWNAWVSTDRAVTGRRSLRLEQIEGGIPKYGVSGSQFFVWDVDPATNPEGDQWSLVAQVYIPSDTWRGPPPDGAGIRLSRYSTTETVSIAPEGGGPAIDYPKPIETITADINADTPRDVWTRLEAALLSPPTGQPEFVQVSINAPDGVAYFDRVSLSLDEGLRYYAADQADIAAGLLAHLQDPAFGKTGLNMAAEMPPTGILRDRSYLFHEHAGGFDALTEFTTLNDGMDFSVALTATGRTVRSHHPARGVYRPAYGLELGRNVADFAWAFDGETAANHIVVLGSGNGSDREEAWASYPSAFADMVTLETVSTTSPETPIDSLESVALEQLAVSVAPEVLTVTTTPAQPGQPDPVGVLAPGDTIPVTIRAGPLPIEGVYRVVSLTLTPDDTLDLTLNRRVP